MVTFCWRMGNYMIRQTWVCLAFCSSWHVEDVWLYTQDHLARLWLMLTRHERHSVNPNFNDRLFLGAGFKYCYVYPYLGKCFRNDPIWLIHNFSNWVVCLTTTDLVEKSLKPSMGQNALGLSKLQDAPIILGVSISVPNFKGRDVETTNSFNLRPSLSHTHLPPWKNSSRIHENPQIFEILSPCTWAPQGHQRRKFQHVQWLQCIL